MRAIPSVVLVLVAWGAVTRPGFAEGLQPPAWSKTMTSDPETNPALKRYTEPLPDRAQAAVRTILLFRLMSAQCVGVQSDRRPVDAAVRTSGLFALPPDERKAAARFGAAQLDYLDYEAVAHLCAGSDYLFGGRGVWVKGAMSKGNGKLKLPYDPANPYIQIKPMFPD